MANNTTLDIKQFSLLDELDSMERTLLIIESIMFVPTVFGNLLILISIYKFKWLQSPLNYLIGNLAVSDLMIGVVLVPLDVFGTFLGLNRLKAVCLVQCAAVVTLIMMSLISMLGISIERYFSVRFPWKHRATERMKYVLIFLPLSWIAIIIFSILPVFGWNHFDDSKKYLNKNCRHVDVWTDTFSAILETLIIVIVSVHIIFFSLVVRIALDKIPKGNASREDCHQIKKHLAKTYLLIMVSAFFIVCWAPYITLTLFSIVMKFNTLMVAQGWSLMLGIFNSGFNWLIYGLKNEKFRKAFKMVLCCENRLHVARPPLAQTSSGSGC